MTDFSTRERPRDRTPDVLLLFAGAVALLLASLGAWSSYQTVRAARQSREQASTSLASLRERIQQLEQSRASTQEQRLASRVVLAAQAPVAAALAALERLMPADVRLESAAVDYDDSCRVEIRVQARRSDAYDEFLGRLFASPYFTDVTPGAEERGDSVSATVRARFRGVKR